MLATAGPTDKWNPWRVDNRLPPFNVPTFKESYAADIFQSTKSFRTGFVIVQSGSGQRWLGLILKHERTELNLKTRWLISRAKLLRCRAPVAKFNRRVLCKHALHSRVRWCSLKHVFAHGKAVGHWSTSACKHPPSCS